MWHMYYGTSLLLNQVALGRAKWEDITSAAKKWMTKYFLHVFLMAGCELSSV